MYLPLGPPCPWRSDPSREPLPHLGEKESNQPSQGLPNIAGDPCHWVEAPLYPWADLKAASLHPRASGQRIVDFLRVVLAVSEACTIGLLNKGLQQGAEVTAYRGGWAPPSPVHLHGLVPELETPGSACEVMARSVTSIGMPKGKKRLCHPWGLLGPGLLGTSLHPCHPESGPGKGYLQLFLCS